MIKTYGFTVRDKIRGPTFWVYYGDESTSTVRSFLLLLLKPTTVFTVTLQGVSWTGVGR